VYNDCLLLSIQVFGNSAWSQDEVALTGDSMVCTLSVLTPFGMVRVTRSKRPIVLKKMVLLYGVSQMCVGLWLCMLNHIEFKDWVSLAFEWVP